MHIAIELNEMRITHIHDNVHALNGLVYLEGVSFKNVLFCSTLEVDFLAGRTHLELNLLFKNLTGMDFAATLTESDKREVIAGTVEGMTPRKVNVEELERQIEGVDDFLEDDPETGLQFRYVHGANKCEILSEGLFPLHATPNPAVYQQAPQRALQREQARAALPIPVAAPTRTVRERTPGSAPIGGVAPIVYGVADRIWEEHGKPRQVGAILVLRKKMMDELEEMGVKRTTASTTLGDWQKKRLAE